MKRSEMLEIIKKALNQWNGAYYDMSLEEHIIDTIENAGMLPPKRHIGDRTEYPNLTVDEYLEFCHSEEINEWEPEDE